MAVIAIRDTFPEGVHAVYTDRMGGNCQSPYHGYNLGGHVGDAPWHVQQNRNDFTETLGAQPCWLNQIHSTKVVDVSTSSSFDTNADASISRNSATACVIMTADCLPVLLCDRSHRVVSAAHAGWRGLANGILENTISAMGGDAQNIVAWLGPCIGADKFQVGGEVRDAFVQKQARAEQAFVADGKQFLADLHLLATQRLEALGVFDIHFCSECTYTLSNRYFSYRREGVTGRMAAAIWFE